MPQNLVQRGNAINGGLSLISSDPPCKVTVILKLQVNIKELSELNTFKPGKITISTTLLIR